MSAKKLLFYLLAVLLGGCVPISLHPLFTDKDIVFEEKLLGVWIQEPNDSQTIWEFRRADEMPNAYRLTCTDKDNKKGSFVAHLVKLKKQLFLDIYPDKLPSEPQEPNKGQQWEYNSLFWIPAHTFVKVSSIGLQVKLQSMNYDKLKELLEREPKTVGHSIIKDGDSERLVLTAPTKKLQAFVLKYADDKNVFADEIVLCRRIAETEKDSTSQKPAESSKEQNK